MRETINFYWTIQWILHASEVLLMTQIQLTCKIYQDLGKYKRFYEFSAHEYGLSSWTWAKGNQQSAHRWKLGKATDGRYHLGAIVPGKGAKEKSRLLQSVSVSSRNFSICISFTACLIGTSTANTLLHRTVNFAILKFWSPNIHLIQVILPCSSSSQHKWSSISRFL